MKRFLVIAVMLVAAAGFMFAEKFEVKSVTGNVTYESAPGKWDAVKIGQKLSESSVINTSVQSKIVIVSESGEEITVKPMQKGTVTDLVKANSKLAKGGKKNPASTIALKSSATDETGAAQGVATASSRASEAKDDYEIDE